MQFQKLHLPAVCFVLLFAGQEAIQIRKCCGKNEYLDVSSQCQKGNSSIQDWIPIDSLIVQSSNSIAKITKDSVSKTVKSIYKNEPLIGFPTCDPEVRDLAVNWKDPDYEDEFYLSYESNGRVFLNYYRKSVFHDNVTLSFSKSFPPDLFCVDNGPDDSYVVVACPCSEITCIRKCCHENMVFHEGLNKCVFVDDIETNVTYRDWRPVFVKSPFEWDDVEIENEYFLLSGRLPPCSSHRGVYIEHQDKQKPFRYIQNGSVKLQGEGQDDRAQSKVLIFIPGNEHCGENSWDDSRGTFEPIVIRCFSEKSLELISKAGARIPLYTPILIISALLLWTSALVLFMEWNPDVEGKLSTRCIIWHISSMAIGHNFVLLSYFLSASSAMCILSGFYGMFMRINQRLNNSKTDKNRRSNDR